MASSPSRLEAARANGAKSRGPRTAEGKQIASQNAVTHGLSARTVVLQNESAEDYQTELRASLGHFRPQGKPETDLVDQLAAAHWRLVRYAGVESGLLDQKMDDQAGWIEDKYEEISERDRLAIAFEALSGLNSSLGLLNRYQARLHREYQRLLKALIELQAGRHARQPKLPNEPKPVTEKPAPAEPAQIAPHSLDGEREQHTAGCAPDGHAARIWLDHAAHPSGADPLIAPSLLTAHNRCFPLQLTHLTHVHDRSRPASWPL
jgi:hypothetical protein